MLVTEKTVIRGHYLGNEKDLIRPFVLKGSGKTDWARRLATIYLKYDRKFNLRADIAFAQMCHETGMLEYTGIAKPEWNNFCGLGITGPGAKQEFKTEELGVLAHYVHLCWYFFEDHVNSLCSRTYDPRHFETAGKHHPKYTGDLTIGFLGGKWAVPGDTYASKIAFYANIINNTLDNSLEDVETPVSATVETPKNNETPLTEPVTKTPPVLSPVVSNKLDVIVQMGHIGRTKGATGTKGEQAFNKALGDEMKALLSVTGLKFRIMGADDWSKPGPDKATIFLSLHGDGSTNPSARGFSFGFKPGSNEVFKETLAKSYKELTGFTRRKDNYTTGLAKYYGWKHLDCKYCNLLEHGFLSNKIERDWLISHINSIAKHHVDLIVNFLKDLKV